MERQHTKRQQTLITKFPRVKPKVRSPVEATKLLSFLSQLKCCEQQ